MSSVRSQAYRAPSLPHLALPANSPQLSILHHHRNNHHSHHHLHSRMVSLPSHHQHHHHHHLHHHLHSNTHLPLQQLNPEKMSSEKSKSGPGAKISQFFHRFSHKHSQSLDSSSPYIPISECHSGSARSSQHMPPPPPPSAASLATNRLSIASNHSNAQQQQQQHVRSSSQSVLSASNNTSNKNSVQQLDVPTNRHFKVYQKCSSNSSLSTSINSSTTTLSISSNLPSNSTISSTLTGLPTCGAASFATDASLIDAFSHMNMNMHERHLSTGSATSCASSTHLYGNCGMMQNSVLQPPPRPPKPAALRSVSCTPAPSEDDSPLPSAPSLLGLRTLTRESSTHSNGSSSISSYGCMSSYPQFASLNGFAYAAAGHQRPKNSVSSSCSSNPSPLGAPLSSRGKDSCVFTYDQLGGSFAEDEQSDKSQPSSPFAPFTPSSVLSPPTIDRALKPRKSSLLDSTRCTYNNCSCVQCTNRYSPAGPFHLQAPRSVACRGRNYSTESASEDDTLALYESNFRSSGSSYCRWEAQTQPPSHLAPLPPQEDEIQYLDLDLDNHTTTVSSTTANALSSVIGSNAPIESRDRSSQFGSVNSLSAAARESQTVYKTIDFTKTEAFNKVRELRGQQHAL